MKPQFLICAFLLLGLVGMESLKEEQFQHLWSNISGHSLPIVVLPAKQTNLKCPAKREQNSLASEHKSEKKDISSLTCFLLYKPGKKGFLSCESFEYYTPQNSQVL